MSDIAKKTQPPGSWPGSKGAKTADDISDATAPRSAVAASVTKSAAGEDKFDEGTHYTHQKESSAPLSEIREEPIKLSDNTQDGLKDIEPTPMSNGTDLHEAGDEVNGELPEVDAEVPEAEGEAPEIQSEAPAVEGEQPVVPEESLGSRSSLTEKAKQAFDLASQNQPTSEARNQFLTSAKANLSALGGFSDKSKTQPPEIEGLEDKPEAPVDAEALQDETAEVEHPITDAQDQAQSFLGEEVPAGSVVPQTEQGETIPEEVEKAPTDLQEQLPSDLGSQQPVNLENAPTELGSKVEGTIPEGTVPEGTIAEGTIPEGTIPEGTIAEGAIPEGTIPEGVQEGTVQGTDVGVPISEVPASELPLDEAGEAIPATSQLGEGTIPEGAELPVDLSILKGGKVNKGGNVVNSDGKVIGRVTEGILMYLVGKKVDENGAIWSDNGKVIGKAEPISDSERDDMLKEPSPFESFPDAVVDGNGMVVSNGEVIGKVVSGDLKVLRGKSVDADGDILDRGGNVIGKAERWEAEPEPEPEPIPEVDRSILAGKRVNKAGNIVDSSGAIYGRVVEGDPKMMIGRMCDKKGNILSESGDIIGRAEVVAEGEREGLKEGPFAELSGCTVAKDGTVVTPSGDIVGRLVTGNPKVLYGRAVDEDGDVLDRNGNVLGKAERWEPEEVEKKKNPLSGRRVNREGNVVDADGNLVGKLTSGNLSICSGKEIDDDGDVVDGKGVTIGHVSLLEDIPEPEPAPQETPEEKEKREQVAQDKKLAVQMTVCVSQCLDKIRPICRMITEKIERAERTPEEERDEEQLVKEVRPLIEEGGRILTEAQGIIKGLDPDGRISANAKHKTAAREASSEEYQLADVLKDLTGDVTQCIENAKKKLEGMPHAKKELNPLWGLLNEPLFQILAAVGLLLNGVLSLVGRLLNGLGLGGLLDGLLGTLGLNRVLEGLGLGSVTESLTGGKKKKKSGGLLGGVLGG